jgi:hypothetical protein
MSGLHRWANSFHVVLFCPLLSSVPYLPYSSAHLPTLPILPLPPYRLFVAQSGIGERWERWKSGPISSPVFATHLCHPTRFLILLFPHPAIIKSRVALPLPPSIITAHNHQPSLPLVTPSNTKFPREGCVRSVLQISFRVCHLSVSNTKIH